MMRALAIASSMLLAAVLTAQGDVRGGDVRQTDGRAGATGAPGAQGKQGKGGRELTPEEAKEEAKKEAAELEKLTPEERLARNVIHGARGYCRLDLAVRPARLMPGQTGTVSITMVLEGPAVIPVPAKVSVAPAGGPPDLTFGPMSMDPPRTSRLASAYQGQPVYDNWAIVQLPVTMSPGLALGSKHQGSLDVTFDLYNGSTAMPIGRFMERVPLSIEVGLAPDPAVLAGKGQGASDPARPNPSDEGKNTAAEVTVQRPVQGPGQGGTATTATEALIPVQPPSQPVSGGEGMQGLSPGGSAFSPLWIVLGGALVFLLVSLALFRRR